MPMGLTRMAPQRSPWSLCTRTVAHAHGIRPWWCLRLQVQASMHVIHTQDVRYVQMLCGNNRQWVHLVDNPTHPLFIHTKHTNA